MEQSENCAIALEFLIRRKRSLAVVVSISVGEREKEESMRKSLE